MDEVTHYTCPHCGEDIQLAVDPTGGDEQHYIEDCPVCCNPNDLTIWFDEDGFATASAQPGNT
ncbi:MAG: CPXCG motif-containing cysteine-rich protein [Planctomycetota bacterium]